MSFDKTNFLTERGTMFLLATEKEVAKSKIITKIRETENIFFHVPKSFR